MSKKIKVLLALIAVVALVSLTVFFTVKDKLNNPANVSDETIGSIVSIAKAKVGNAVKFGSYEQDNNTANGKESIIWRVLSVGKDKALLLSVNILDCKPYDEKEKESVSWENCTLREWLNNDFMSKTFTATEIRTIITANLDNSRYDSPRGYYSPSGNDTKDKVFILSLAEAEKYFKSDSARQASGTVFSRSKGLDVAPVKNTNAGNSYWWLRSPGYYPSCAGSIDFYGNAGDYAVTGTRVGVRPALWVKTNG